MNETFIGFSDKSSGGRKTKIYNLDMILSVGYHVNSKRGITFRRWTNFVLKQYVIQGKMMYMRSCFLINYLPIWVIYMRIL